MHSNCIEENSCEILEEKKMNCKLVAGLGEMETKVLNEEGSYPMRRNNRSLAERIYEIETRLNNFQALVMREKARNEGLPV